MSPTVEDLDQLAQALAVTVAPQLAFAVHQRDADIIRELLDLTPQQLRALAVVLAAQIPQPRTRPDDGVIDEVAVARATAGQQVILSRAERLEAVRVLAGQGAGVSVIARRLHMSGAGVNRLLDKTRETA